MTLYQSDLKYTFSKIIFFIILAIVYIYFFRVNGIIEPIMKLFNYAKTKITVDMPLVTEKVIKNIPKVPEIKTS
jgi:spore maturation protein SpmB